MPIILLLIAIGLIFGPAIAGVLLAVGVIVIAWGEAILLFVLTPLLVLALPFVFAQEMWARHKKRKEAANDQ
jgi:MFS family permease